MSVIDKYTLKPALAETFGGIIWKIEIDGNSPIVAIESRNVAERQSFYSAFNYATGQTLFKEITVENSWFWSIDRVHDGIVFLHSYVHESQPEHKGIIALDSTGEVKWQSFNVTLYDISTEGIIVYNPKIQPRTLEMRAFEDGAPIPYKTGNYQPVARNITLPNIVEKPDHLQNLLPDTLTGPVFYTQFKNKDIVAFHSKAGNFYRQQLVVYQDGKVVLEDILARDIQKLNPEAFFIEREQLFYIRNNKQEFVSYLV